MVGMQEMHNVANLAHRRLRHQPLRDGEHRQGGHHQRDVHSDSVEHGQQARAPLDEQVLLVIMNESLNQSQTA